MTMTAAGSTCRFFCSRFGSPSFTRRPLPPMFPNSLLKRPIFSSIGSRRNSTSTTIQTNIRFLLSVTRPNFAAVQFHLSLTTRRQIHHSSADAAAHTWNPLRVSSMWDEVMDLCPCQRQRGIGCTCDGDHRIVTFHTNGEKFQTEQELFDFYIKTLARLVKDEEEAKKKIYLVSCGWVYGFGFELDKNKAVELTSLPGVASVGPDFKFNERNRVDSSCQSTIKFTPMNPNRRLDNIYSYYWSSKEKKSDSQDTNHWLVHIKQPNGEFDDHNLVLYYVIQLLTYVVGSEKAARKKIYIIWYELPFGFAAELTGEELKKLKGTGYVLNILPDYAFDLKDIGRFGRGALHIYPVSRSFECSRLAEEHGSIVSGLEIHGNEARNPIYPKKKCDPNPSGNDSRLDVKHWFITMKMTIGDAYMQQKIDCCIQTLADVLQSTKEHAKNKIYRIECESDLISFGANIDMEIADKLEGASGVLNIHPDELFNDFPEEDVFFAKVWREMAVNMKGWVLEPEP